MVNKVETLKKKVDFHNLKLHGKRLKASNWLLINYIRNSEGKLRIGVTFPASVAPAVLRNRMRRWTKEFFRRRNAKIGVDIHLIFRNFRDGSEGYKTLSHADFDGLLEKSWNAVERFFN